MEIQELINPALAELTQPASATPLTSTAKVDWRDFRYALPKLAEMREAAQVMGDEIASGHPARWLTLTGRPGAGKTHLARCLWRWFEDCGQFAMAKHERAGRTPSDSFWIAPKNSFVRWRTAAAEIRDGQWRLIQDYAAAWFLVIDDIGAEHQGGTGVVQSTLERLLDDRLGKWTVITSNLSLGEIAVQMDARIASRMKRQGNIVVDAKGVPDFNLPAR